MFWTFWFWKIVQKKWWYWYYCIGKMMGLLFQIYSHSQWKWIKMHLSPLCRPAVTTISLSLVTPAQLRLSMSWHSYWAYMYSTHFAKTFKVLPCQTFAAEMYTYTYSVYSNEISWKELVKMQKDEGMSLRTDNKMGESPLHCWR